MNFQNSSPAVDEPFNTNHVASCTVTTCSCTNSGGYWSSTTEPVFALFAWYVYFSDCSVFDTQKSNSFGARAVRGGV